MCVTQHAQEPVSMLLMSKICRVEKGVGKVVKPPRPAIDQDFQGNGDDALNSVNKEEKPAIHNREALEQ